LTGTNQGEGAADVEIGYSLSSEEMRPDDMVRWAARAEATGFSGISVSDHFHPWTDRQGQSPFVWSVLGGIAATTEHIKVGTGVTCPTIRTHPAIIAQAAATMAVMMPGRFFLGVGSGEALNEHIVGARWPEIDVRLDMLEEAIEVLRMLWQGGSRSHHGRHYTVENARIYTLPDEPPPIVMSGFGPKSTALAARVADGYFGTTPEPDLVDQYRNAGGRGSALALMKVCWHESEQQARELAHEIWPTIGLSGELSQELPVPAHFEQAAQRVTVDDVAEPISCGPDPEQHLASIRKYRDAGYDEVYIQQIGPDQEGFFRFYSEDILPKV
jgi:G6PDH family F420-dependent oxidoreductase